MKKIYSVKFLFILSLLMMSLLVYGQKTILFVGGAATAEENAADFDLIDSLKNWGFVVYYMDDAVFNESTDTMYNGKAGAIFSETCGSTGVTVFGPFRDNFPIDWITLEAGAMSNTSDRWALFEEGTGGIVINNVSANGDEFDLQYKITDNTHYITEIFDLNQIVTWSDGTDYKEVPYVHHLIYSTKTLAMPVAPTDEPTAFAIGVIDDFNLPVQMFYFGMSAQCVQGSGADQHYGTNDYYKIMKRAAEWTFDAIPEPPSDIKDNLIQNYGLIAFPNPASEIVTIRFKAPVAGNAKVTLYDVTGQQLDILIDVDVQTGYRIINLDVTDYPEGIYFVRLNAGEHTEYIKLLVK
jgi:hypothetical protein